MFTKSNQIYNFGGATRFQSVIVEGSFCSMCYTRVKCTEANCRVSNSVQIPQAPFFFTLPKQHEANIMRKCHHRYMVAKRGEPTMENR